MSGDTLDIMSIESFRARLWTQAEPYVNQSDYRFDKTLSARYSADIINSRDTTALEIKKTQLSRFSIGMLPYLDEEELAYWVELLKEAFSHALHLYNYNHMLQRKQAQKETFFWLQRFHYDLFKVQQALNARKGCNDDSPSPIDKLSDKTLPFTPKGWLQEQFSAFCLTPSVFARDWLSEINTCRLYWVWAGGNGGLLAAILTLPGVQSTLDIEGKMAQRLDLPLTIWGYLSWGLYFVRLTIHCLLMLKHLIPGKWMSEEEKQLGVKKRLALQWSQRQFTMLNDLVWGSINFATIYWLTGDVSKLAGAWGGVLTVALMLFDVYLARKALKEETLRFETRQGLLKTRSKTLASQWDALTQDIDPGARDKIRLIKAYLERERDRKRLPEEDTRIAELSRQINLEQCERLLTLQREQRILREEQVLLEFDWYYKEKTLRSTLFCNSVFVPVMALIVGNVLPDLVQGVALSTTLLSSVTVVGGVLAVLITAYQSYYAKQQTIDKLTAKRAIVSAKLDELSASAEPDSGLTAIELARLGKEEKHLTELIHHERLNQVFSVSMQFIFAAVVFASLALSTPIGLSVIGGVLLCALAIKIAIMKSKPVEPEKQALPTAEDSSTSMSVAERELNGMQSPALKKIGFFNQNRDTADCYIYRTLLQVA